MTDLEPLTQEHVDQVRRDRELAANHEGPYRAMRVTLECGHLRLMTYGNVQAAQIGNQTACPICPAIAGSAPARTVVNIEETGVLHADYRDRNRGTS